MQPVCLSLSAHLPHERSWGASIGSRRQHRRVKPARRALGSRSARSVGACVACCFAGPADASPAGLAGLARDPSFSGSGPSRQRRRPASKSWGPGTSLQTTPHARRETTTARSPPRPPPTAFTVGRHGARARAHAFRLTLGAIAARRRPSRVECGLKRTLARRRRCCLRLNCFGWPSSFLHILEVQTNAPTARGDTEMPDGRIAWDLKDCSKVGMPLWARMSPCSSSSCWRHRHALISAPVVFRLTISSTFVRALGTEACTCEQHTGACLMSSAGRMPQQAVIFDSGAVFNTQAALSPSSEGSPGRLPAATSRKQYRLQRRQPLRRWLAWLHRAVSSSLCECLDCDRLLGKDSPLIETRRRAATPPWSPEDPHRAWRAMEATSHRSGNDPDCRVKISNSTGSEETAGHSTETRAASFESGWLPHSGGSWEKHRLPMHVFAVQRRAHGNLRRGSTKRKLLGCVEFGRRAR